MKVPLKVHIASFAKRRGGGDGLLKPEQVAEAPKAAAGWEQQPVTSDSGKTAPKNGGERSKGKEEPVTLPKDNTVDVVSLSKARHPSYCTQGIFL